MPRAKGSRRNPGRRAPARRGGALVLPARAHPEFELRTEVVERALRDGEQQGLLEDYFGGAQYAVLRGLAREAAARSVRGGPPVLVLPGIMGSTLGYPRPGPFDDVLWFDPLDIAAGRFSELALPDTPPPLQPLGVILLAYLKLALRLRLAGYAARFHPYDWRLGLDELGRQLAARIREEGVAVDLVAHSMGGLVARAAIAQGAPCRRLVMLGTPNHGSFMPVMAFRGTEPTLRKLAFIDVPHRAEALARDVVATFPGLAQMLPFRSHFQAVDLLNPAGWPADGLRPRDEVLRGVAKAQEGLAPGAGSFFLVAGVGRRTVTGLRAEAGAFLYEFSTEGDGTVPLELALLPGVGATYYTGAAHGSLPNDAAVERAVIDLLARGQTDALPSNRPPAARAGVEVVPEDALRVEPYEARRGTLLGQAELRHLLDAVAAPDAQDEGAPAAGALPPGAAGPSAAPALDQVVVGRRRQHRIDVRFALGDIADVDARAAAVGVFRGVTPAGAASALDGRMGGAISEVWRRRMFSGQLGELFVLPTGRHPVSIDLVVFVGLGDFDRFGEAALQIASENLLRTLVAARVEELATVVLGGGSGEDLSSALRGLFAGLVRGLLDADRDHSFRRLILCEVDPSRFARLKEEILRLASTPLCAELELTFDEVRARPQVVAAPEPRSASAGRPSVYLVARQEQPPGDGAAWLVRTSVLTAGNKATVVTGVREVARDRFERLREAAVSAPARDLARAGGALAELLLAEEVRQVLGRLRDLPLVVVHDGDLSRVPWEVLALRNGAREAPWFPAAEAGMSHRYAADRLSVTKWLDERVRDDVLHVLLVVNPTGDLDGAEAEGARIRERVAGRPGVRLDVLRGAEATRPALLEALGSGRYDFVHYAGHAYFDEDAPGRSGIVCSGHATVTGADVALLRHLPALVFFNACEAARLRGEVAGRPGPRSRKTPATETTAVRHVEHLRRGVALAEALMRGGLANFLGTYWPVDDRAAATFAERFYAGVLAGRSVGAAVLAGRAALRETSRDWANYVLYGNADFVLKEGIAARGATGAPWAGSTAVG